MVEKQNYHLHILYEKKSLELTVKKLMYELEKYKVDSKRNYHTPWSKSEFPLIKPYDHIGDLEKNNPRGPFSYNFYEIGVSEEELGSLITWINEYKETNNLTKDIIFFLHHTDTKKIGQKKAHENGTFLFSKSYNDIFKKDFFFES